jgi:sugar fermentation stimulation protein A
VSARHATVPLARPLVEARFVARPNRFLVQTCLADGTLVEAHLPDPGRLRELLVEERRVWLRHASRPGRKTHWTLVLAQTPVGDGLVSLDTTLPNRLIGHALRLGVLEELSGWALERAEVPVGRSRFDFLLSSPTGSRLLLEVKSITLVESGVGLFPDAVTQRGARHLRELAEAAQVEDQEAAVLFVAQRSDVHRVRAAPEIDPRFAEALADARGAGVRVLARRCDVTLERVMLDRPLPVE